MIAQLTFLRQYALLFFTWYTQIIQRYIKLFTPALWHYIQQIILIPWHVQFLFEKSVLLENDYLQNDPTVSFFKCTAKKIICCKKITWCFFSIVKRCSMKQRVNLSSGKRLRKPKHTHRWVISSPVDPSNTPSQNTGSSVIRTRSG